MDAVEKVFKVEEFVRGLPPYISVNRGLEAGDEEPDRKNTLTYYLKTGHRNIDLCVGASHLDARFSDPNGLQRMAVIERDLIKYGLGNDIHYEEGEFWIVVSGNNEEKLLKTIRKCTPYFLGNEDRSNVRKVLVIEDESYNLESAKSTLNDYDLTVIGTIEEANKILRADVDGNFEYDVMLTDLWIPTPELVEECETNVFANMGTVSVDKLHIFEGASLDKSMPAGLVFALKASNLGVPYIGILTDSSHHHDRLSLLLDTLRESGLNRVHKFVDTPFVGGCYFDKEKGSVVNSTDTPPDCNNSNHRFIKDWGRALRMLLETD